MVIIFKTRLLIKQNLDYKQVGSKYVVSDWNSKRIYTTKLAPLHSLRSTIKYFDQRIGLKVNNSFFNRRYKQFHK